jgi:hypothetical protein
MGSIYRKLNLIVFLPLRTIEYEREETSAIPRNTGCIMNMPKSKTAAKKSIFTAG